MATATKERTETEQQDETTLAAASVTHAKKGPTAADRKLVAEVMAEVAEKAAATPLKATVGRDALARALATVGRATGGRTTLPVLNNVLLDGADGVLTLSATNLETAIRTPAAATIESPGRITVPAKLLTDFVASLPASQDVRLEAVLASSTLRVSCTRYTATIKGIDAEEFPKIPEPLGAPVASIPAALLRETVGQVAPAAAKDELRPVLAGVHLTAEGSTLTLAAADGFRLAVRTADLAEVSTGEVEAVDVIIPWRALAEVARLPGTGNVELRIAPNKSQVLMTVGDVLVVSRLLEGQYPDLQRVIPKAHLTRIVAQRSDLLAATKQAALFARDAANVVKLEAKATEVGDSTTGQVSVAARAAEVGESRTEFGAIVEGEEVEVSFSSVYLAEALTMIGTDEVALELSGPMSPVALRGIGLAGYVHIVMPMHSVR